jgi:hypothetical protein
MMDTFWGDDVHVNRGGAFVIRADRAATVSKNFVGFWNPHRTP